jgi:hypothetical protein
MTAKLTPNIQLIFCLGCASALFGQIDSYQLRAKYGPPLNRETFTISPGFEIIVDYGPDQQVCRLQLPASAPSGTEQQVDDVLLELVPMSMRGKKIGSSHLASGAFSVTTTQYEHVLINEPHDASRPGGRTGVNVIFNREECRNP